MKKILLFIVVAAFAASCSEKEYDFCDSTDIYYPVPHYEPPSRTLTGKLIFDYAFDAFLPVPQLLQEVFKLNECLSSERRDSAEIFERYFYDCSVTSSANLWKISRQEQILIVDTRGSLLTDSGAEWNVYCNIEGLYVARDCCSVSYEDDGRVAINISGGRFDDLFDGTADFSVGWRVDELNVARPYMFDMTGGATLAGVSNPDFKIIYTTVQELTQTQTRYLFFNGRMNVLADFSSGGSDEVQAELSVLDEIRIDYGGYSDLWVYRGRRY